MPLDPRASLIPALVADQFRLAALDHYAILDTAPEEGFDDIVQLATHLCEVPVALISLVAADRQWFKARIGFPPCETDLNSSVCAHALGEPDILVIPDLTQDARTHVNPLVRDEPNIRFYAGAPLRTAEGHAIGSLCVIDTQPRPSGLTPAQMAGLRALARQVMSQLELRHSLAEQRILQHFRDVLGRTQIAISEAKGDLDAILDLVVAGAMEAVSEAEGAVLEFTDGEALECRAVRGSLAAFKGQRLGFDDSLSGACFQSGEGVLVADAWLDPRVDQALARRMKMRACVCAPVFRGRHPVGLLKLQASTAGAFNDLHLQLVGLFAGAASTGLAEAREAAAQRAVETSEARYRAIFDSAIDYAIIVLDLDGNITNWNEGATRILGWAPAEICGKPAGVFFTPEDNAAGIPKVEMTGAIAEGRGLDERWHLRKSGERFWASGEMMALRDPNGAAVGFVKILRDRTEQRLTEERLKLGDERLQMALSASGVVGLWDWMTDTDLLYGDANFARLYGLDLGRTAAGLTMEQYQEFVVPQDLGPLRASIRDVFDGGAEFLVDYRLAIPGQPLRWVECKGQMIYDPEGKARRFSGTAVDITERKQAETKRVALLDLGDRLRATADRKATLSIAAEILNRTLSLSHAGYGTVDDEAESIEVVYDQHDSASGSLVGTHRFRDYGSHIENLRVGDTVQIADVTQDSRTQAEQVALSARDVRALVNYPVMERGRFVALFFAVKSTPHDWSGEEVEFLRNVGDRTQAALARIAAEEQQRILNLELSHRMKNMLAMVQSIASQSMRGAADMETARAVLADRLVALGKSHDLLLGGSLTSAPLRGVIENALQLHLDRPDRFAIDGPDIAVGSKAALSLSLIMHELATNAAKYGALTVPEGRVRIAWAVEKSAAGPEVTLCWTEAGGPPVAAPIRSGFGTRLIGRGLAGSFEGQATLTYPVSGAVCTIKAPLSGLEAGAHASSER